MAPTLTKTSDLRVVAFDVTDGPTVNRVVPQFDGPPYRQDVKVIGVMVNVATDAAGESTVVATQLVVDTEVGSTPVAAYEPHDDADTDIALVVGLARQEALDAA